MIESISNFLSGDGGLLSLIVSAFVSATLFPGGSEAVLAASVATFPDLERALLLVCLATAANTAGSMTSWLIGRFLPQRQEASKALAILQRYGSPSLLLAWLPIVGDALPLAAGWLRIGFCKALLWISLRKFLRYALVAGAVLGIV